MVGVVVAVVGGVAGWGGGVGWGVCVKRSVCVQGWGKGPSPPKSPETGIGAYARVHDDDESEAWEVRQAWPVPAWDRSRLGMGKN